MTRERHALEDLTAFLDGALAAGRAAEVRDHLARCAGCRREEARLRRAIATLTGLPPAPELPPRLALRLEARLRQERERRPRLLRWLAGPGASIPRPRLALAGAAALVVAAAAVGAGVAVRAGQRDRAIAGDLDLLQDYETASAVGVDTPEDALIVAQLDQLEREGKP